MIEIIDITSKKNRSNGEFDFSCFPKYPDLQPDDILFVFYTRLGSQGENSYYVVTYTGVVYRVSIFEFGSYDFIERICPFVKGCKDDTIPHIELLVNPDERFKFERNDWCWVGAYGANTILIHASMANDFAHATKCFNSMDMYKKWLNVASELVEKLIKDTNPKNEKLMFENTDINRFLEAQQIPDFCGYTQALEEVNNGKKTNHWIWYIFPQLRCLGRSSRAHYYGIADKYEAEAYLAHNILGARLREITEALLKHKDKTALSIFGDIDALKVRSCMTMFDYLSPNDIFGEVLDSFYQSERCELTLKVMRQA